MNIVVLDSEYTGPAEPETLDKEEKVEALKKAMPKNLNRGFIGIELDEEYFRIAKERIEAS